MVNSIPSSVNPFSILTKVLHIRMSTTLMVYVVWYSGTVLMFIQMLSGPLCWFMINKTTCSVCTLLHWRFYWHSHCVTWQSSVMHLIFIQTEKAPTQLLCNYNWQFWASLPAAPSSLHKLQAHDSKLQYSCLFPGYARSRFMCSI